MSAVLAAAGAGIFLLLGLAHAMFSLQSRPDGGPLMPTSSAVREAMVEVGGLGMAPEIDNTLYRAWIGFNLSHALGIIVSSAIGVGVIVDDVDAAARSPWFVMLAIIVPLAYLVLAAKYWFAKPRDAILLGALLLWSGLAATML